MHSILQKTERSSSVFSLQLQSISTEVWRSCTSSETERNHQSCSLVVLHHASCLSTLLMMHLLTISLASLAAFDNISHIYLVNLMSSFLILSILLTSKGKHSSFRCFLSFPHCHWLYATHLYSLFFFIFLKTTSATSCCR